MDIIQTICLLVLLSMAVYFILANIFKVNAVHTPGVIKMQPSQPNQNQLTKEHMQNPSVVHQESHDNHTRETSSDHISNNLPQHVQFHQQMKYPTPAKIELDASTEPGSAIWNPEATGIYAQNQDMFDKPVNFGSDVTNIKQFYTNNPEVFGKIIGKSEVTNVADWDRQSKEMFTAAQTSSSGPIQAANFQDNFSAL
jgi:hypothetical protein